MQHNDSTEIYCLLPKIIKNRNKNKKYLQLSKSEKLRQPALATLQLLNSFTFVETN